MHFIEQGNLMRTIITAIQEAGALISIALFLSVVLLWAEILPYIFK